MVVITQDAVKVSGIGEPWQWRLELASERSVAMAKGGEQYCSEEERPGELKLGQEKVGKGERAALMTRVFIAQLVSYATLTVLHSSRLGSSGWSPSKLYNMPSFPRDPCPGSLFLGI